jgi:cysteine desulfurase / selenocysteine lyase
VTSFATRSEPQPGAERPGGGELGAVRAQFPLLASTPGLAYLDSAATAQKPRAVLEAMDRFQRERYGPIARGVHRLSAEATAAYEGARERVARFVNASADEIVFVRGTTEAINLVAASFVRSRLAPGDEILVTELEHHSNLVPWQLAAAERGARVVAVPIDERGDVTPEAFARALTPRTKMAAVAHISNTLGTVLPVAELTAIARERGVPVLVDGAQAAPHRQVDVAALGCDFYAFSAHKLYGPTGIGALYGRRDHFATMPPYQGGGGMIREVTIESTTWDDPPRRFEAGTPAATEAVGFAAAIDFVESLGWAEIAAHERALLDAALAGLGAIDGVKVVGDPRERSAVVSFVLAGAHAHDVGTVLDHHGIAVRAGHHCTQPLHRKLGLAATVRASFGVYNDERDVARLVGAVRAAGELFAR